MDKLNVCMQYHILMGPYGERVSRLSLWSKPWVGAK